MSSPQMDRYGSQKTTNAQTIVLIMMSPKQLPDRALEKRVATPLGMPSLNGSSMSFLRRYYHHTLVRLLLDKHC
ncbi:hypothetical protein BAUCODRAFT_119306 [Baudoinia panamericana UAMH 10762]|uniref:Uncharacterized protein n=1 Tax=Baudoinia panamericana (strain UAMH 10762) TaxID=717646 RepID=M2NKR2_BAUPA|nr:uncharacterized protein BAUCODRAFT_119306 [Baudoinia panamericana UAMH 10762]EMC99735.1 hypothetical protein BAUCODRAFT_119306 [Baudoinia panamericana UAMH 10762]